MSRPRSLKPAYCLHRTSGRAFVKLDGHRVYLGPHGTQESRDAYDRTIGEWIARGRQSPAPPVAEGTAPPATITVLEVADAFWTANERFHLDGDGAPTAANGHFRSALRLMNRLYGTKPATEFGPLALKTVRAEMLKPVTTTDPVTKKTKTRPGWSRHYANEQVGRLKRVFRWAAENELVPVAVYHALATVGGLRRGQSDARETESVKPVPQGDIDAVLPLLSRQVKAMAELQLFTGMRPGEVCQIRTADIDMTDSVWTYSPTQHKGAHRGHAREIRIGPRAQAVLRPFLKTDLQAHVFSPAEAEAERREARRKARKTPAGYGNSPGSNRKDKPAKKPGDRYGVRAYRHAIVTACARAGVEPWHPHALRHNAATAIRKEFGLDAARAVLGHRSPGVTTIYAEMDNSKNAEVMAKMG